MLTLSLGWVALMGLLAQMRIPLPFTPVPFTMQVFGSLLGGVVLGTRYGALAQTIYVSAGILGALVPGLDGGWASWFGPIGGNLVATAKSSA